MDNAFTVLQITGVGVTPFSSRGLKQSLAPIDQAANVRRTVNGALKDLSFSGFRKYKSTISGTDQDPPNVDGRWPGLTVTVDCISELSYNAGIGETPQRTVVTGSDRITSWPFRSYRPQLIMKVIAFSLDQDEYDRTIGWSMDLEEV